MPSGPDMAYIVIHVRSTDLGPAHLWTPRGAASAPRLVNVRCHCPGQEMHLIDDRAALVLQKSERSPNMADCDFCFVAVLVLRGSTADLWVAKGLSVTGRWQYRKGRRFLAGGTECPVKCGARGCRALLSFILLEVSDGSMQGRQAWGRSCSAARLRRASLRKTLRQERVETLLSAEQSALLSQEQAVGHRRAVLEEEGETMVLQALEQIAARATAFLGPVRRGASRRPLFLRRSRPPSLSSSKGSRSVKQRLCF